MATTMEPAGGSQLLSERVAAGILPKVLNSFDMVAIFVAIVLFITNAGVIQSAGPTAFGWWILGFLLFLIPGAIVTGQLGLMFPGEGSIYLWTHKAFGPFWGFFAGFCAWWPGILVMVATGTIVFAFLGFVFPDTIGTLDVTAQGILITAFILFSAVLSILRFRVTQNIVNVVFVLYGVAILLMGLAGVVWLAGGHPAATDPLNFAAYGPGEKTGINFTNWTFFGLVILALLGVEVPLNMGVEIKDPKAITRYLFYGGLVVIVAYLIATFGVMVTVPPDQAFVPTAVAAAVGIAFGDPLGKLVALVLAGFFLFITVVYNYSFARLIFVSGLDRRLPPAMGQVNENKVPANAVWVQTIVAGAFTLLAFDILPALGVGGGTPVDVQTRVYDILQAAVTVIWCISMVILFVDVVIIINRFHESFRATRLARPGVFYLSSIVGGIAAFVGIIATLSGSWAPQLIPNDSGTLDILGAQIGYGTWFYWIAGIAIVSLIIGAILYFVGHRIAEVGRPEAMAGPAS